MPAPGRKPGIHRKTARNSKIGLGRPKSAGGQFTTTAGPGLNKRISSAGMPYQGRIYRERQSRRLAGHVIENGLFDGPQFGLDLVKGPTALLDGGIGVLEAVTSQGTNHSAALRDLARTDIVHSASK